MSKKKLLVMICCVLLMMGASGATLAWLSDETQNVENTFTIGNIGIDLNETDADNDGDADKNAYKMIPGFTLAKDPKVTVEKGSEDCWVFVEVKEIGGDITVEGDSYNFDSFISYEVTSDWTLVPGYTEDMATKVYYHEQASLVDATANAEYPVLVGNKVTVKDTVTKAMMDTLKTAVDAKTTVLPQLTFKAYAIQKYEANGDAFTVTEAWDKLSGE